MPLILVGAFAALLASGNVDLLCRQTAAHSVFVDIRANGDDGLTQRLKDAIEGAFNACRGFSTRYSTATDLAVRITSNVTWKRVGNRGEALFEVEYLAGEHRQKSIKVFCWEDRLGQWAQQVLHATPSTWLGPGD